MTVVENTKKRVIDVKISKKGSKKFVGSGRQLWGLEGTSEHVVGFGDR